MRAIIAGSRTLGHRKAEVLAAIKELVATLDGPVTQVVSGKAPGVDTIGEYWAKYSHEVPIPIASFPADWDRYGSRAGPIRNWEMAANADVLILIWDGESTGSADMKRKALKAGLKVLERVLGPIV